MSKNVTKILKIPKKSQTLSKFSSEMRRTLGMLRVMFLLPTARDLAISRDVIRRESPGVPDKIRNIQRFFRIFLIRGMDRARDFWSKMLITLGIRPLFVIAVSGI